MISAAGVKRMRCPSARNAAQKSTSSPYRKNRSSSQPAAAPASRRTRRHAPLTHSGWWAVVTRRSNQRTTGPMPRARPRAMSFCRASFQGDSMRPKDSSTAPSRPTRRGPAAAAAGSSSRAPARRSMLPGGTTVSLLSSKTMSLSQARIPALVAAANPAFRPISMTRTSVQAVRIAWTLPSEEPLSTTTMVCVRSGGASCSDCRHVWRSRRVLKLTITMARRVMAVAPRRSAERQASPPRRASTCSGRAEVPPARAESRGRRAG